MSNKSTYLPLYGSCSCGRNHLSITLPSDAVAAGRQARVYFDSSRLSTHLPTPVLRVPLTWVSTTTIAQFPDETHTSIRRTFTPTNAPHVKHVFCGYCGTHLSRWSEQPRSEAEFLNVMLDTIGSRGLDLLEELDLLQTAAESEPDRQNEDSVVPTTTTTTTTTTTSTTTTTRQGQAGSLSWYEELIDGSILGRTLQTRRGVGATADGSTTVQWEVSEWTDGDSGDNADGDRDRSPSKRKVSEIDADDVGMAN